MKRSILLIFSVAVMAYLAACGSGGGGGSERFSTVEIFASYEENTYTADAEIGEDTDGDGTCDTFSFTTDDTVATVTSIAYDSLPTDLNPCDVNILRYSVVFWPQTGDSPEIPSKIIYHQMNIPAPGGAGNSVVVDIPIRLFDINDKAYLLPLYFASPAAEFQYSAKVRLTMEEVCTRIQEHVEFWIPVRYFDEATDSCN
jgi:hypothetical protein